jgi:hypothetical protein
MTATIIWLALWFLWVLWYLALVRTAARNDRELTRLLNQARDHRGLRLEQ